MNRTDNSKESRHLLEVPERYNKNAKEVRELGTPTDTGTALLKYMARRLGRADLGGLKILDFGCGSRFAEAIVNNRIPLKRYVGLDLDAEMIAWLSKNVKDRRLSFRRVNHYNPGYNPGGEPLTATTKLPVGLERFDLACMFSVITHQEPAQAIAIFHILHRYVKRGGHLFFSARVDAEVDGYREQIPERPTAFSAYSPALLERLLRESGWSIVSFEPRLPEGLPIQDSYLCERV